MTPRRMSRVLPVGLASVLLLLVGLLSPPVTQGATTPSAVRNARLQGVLDELVATGASGAIARGDDGAHTWRLASGAARLDPPVSMRPSARFRIASETKTFVATVALQLVGEGTLRLDDTVARWVPGLLPNGRAITLRMLLNHTSGLLDYTEDQDFLSQVIADPGRVWSPRELVAIAKAHPTTFRPG